MTLPTITVEVDFGGSIGVEDLSAYWDATAGLEITQGRPGVGQDVTPGTLTIQFTNDDGRFTPENPASAYWPQVVAGLPITVTATKGGDSRPLFAGTITDWQPEYPDGDLSRAFVRVSAVDALGVLAGKVMRHIVHERVMAPDGNLTYAPLHYWACDEPPGSDGVDNLVGGEALFVRGSGGSLEFESTELAVVPPVSGAAFTRSSASVGKYLRGTATGGASSSNEFEFILWLQISEVTAGTVGVAQWTLRDGTTVALTLVDGQPQAELTRPNGSLVLTTPLTIDALEVDVAHMVCIDMADEFGGEWALYLSVDADQSVDTTASDPGTWDLSRVTVEVGRATAALGADYLTAATVAGVGIAESVAQLNYYDLWQKGVSTEQQVYGNDTTVTRTRMICARAGLDVPTLASDSGMDVGSQSTAGRTALDVLIELHRHRGSYIQATHDADILDVRGTGSTRRSGVSLQVDVEDDGVGSPTFSRSDIGFATVVTARGVSGQTTYRDGPLASTYGNIEAVVETPLATRTTRYYAAQDRVAQGRYVKLRPQRFTFDLHSAANDLYPDWLGGTASRIGARIRLTGLPASHFGYTSIDGYLEGFTERISLAGYEVTVDLSSTDPVEGVWDTHRFGFGDGVCTLSSSVSSSATSMTLTWTGSASLSTSAGDYPMDLDVDGERVTIGSAPAGGTSPRTVTVTRGVGGTVARAHDAGAPVEVWDVDRYAY